MSDRVGRVNRSQAGHTGQVPGATELSSRQIRQVIMKLKILWPGQVTVVRQRGQRSTHALCRQTEAQHLQLRTGPHT